MRRINSKRAIGARYLGVEASWTGSRPPAWDLPETMVRDAMREQALTPEAVETPIRVVELSEHPRLRGAAALVFTPAFAAPTVA